MSELTKEQLEARIVELTHELDFEKDCKETNQRNTLTIIEERNRLRRELETERALSLMRRDLLQDLDAKLYDAGFRESGSFAGGEVSKRLAAALQELADMRYLDDAACKGGTWLDIPAEIPGFDPQDGSDHLHFVAVPIGARSRRAAVEYLKAKE